MAGIIDNFRQMFRSKDILIQFILVNVLVWLALLLLNVVTVLFKFDALGVVNYLGVPSDFGVLLYRPWTVFTYMFTHVDLLHILVNMLMLFGFGRLFLSFFNARTLGSLYILGGLGGAAFYLLAFNTIPYYVEMHDSIMIGASASVMAIIFGVAFYRPNQQIQLLLIGRIKISYVALFLFVLDFVALASDSNPGGHIAHIGGAIVGYIFARRYAKGKDITRWMSRIMDWVANLTKPRPKKQHEAKFNYSKRESDYTYNEKKKETSADIDLILDKIKASGYSSLTSNEKKQLFDASNSKK